MKGIGTFLAAAMLAAGDGLIDNPHNIFYATCSEHACKRLRTFQSIARAKEAGWYIEEKMLCPRCAEKINKAQN